MRLATEPPLEPARYPFTHRLRVRFAETDAMGIVHHAAYLPFLEEARVAWLRDIGHPYVSVQQDDGVDFGVLEAFVQYRRPLRFDEEVDVHVAFGTCTRATFELCYLLTVGGDVRATGVTVHGAMQPNGRPTRLPRWIVGLPSLGPSEA